MSDKQAKIKYDPQVDILRIRFSEIPIEDSEEVQPGLIIDFDANGQIVGMELLDASLLLKHLEPTTVATKP